MNFLDKIAEKVVPFAAKLSSQKYLAAIRDSFIEIMPLVIVGSFMVLINNVILSTGQVGLFFWWKDGEVIFSQIRPVFSLIWYGSLNIVSLLIVFSVAYKLAEHYGEKPLYFGLLAVGCLLVLFPQIQTLSGSFSAFIDEGKIVEGVKPAYETARVNIWGAITGTQVGPAGLFMAFLTGILSTEVLRALSKIKLIMIKMPDAVPPAVAKSFNILIPSFLTMLIFAGVAHLLQVTLNLTAQDIINRVIQAPVSTVLESYPGILLVMILQNLLWSFGIHGAFALSPVVEPTLLVALSQNEIAYKAGEVLPNIVTKPFIDAFVLMGGGGTTIGLISAIFIASKREDYKAVAGFSMVPGSFNINEPLIFGLPAILNPLLMLPMVIAPVVCLTIAYVTTAYGLIGKTFILVPWTTPPILSAFLATGGDFRAAILALILIVISTVIYLPFVILLNKEKQYEENM